MRSERRSRRRGTALVVVVILMLLLAAVATTVGTATLSQGNASIDVEASAHALLVADNGLAKGRVLCGSQYNTYKGYATATMIVSEDGAAVTCRNLGPTTPTQVRLLLRSTGTFQGHTRVVELVVTITVQVIPPLPARGLGAIVANGGIAITGDLVVDGRDHTVNGGLGGGSDKPAAVVMGTVTRGGNAKLGGGNVAPQKPPVENVTVDNGTSMWAQDLNGDGDTSDPGESTFPDRLGNLFDPRGDAALAQTRETGLRERAIQDGTFFTTKAQYDAWRTAATQADLGGRVIWLEVPDGTSLGVFDLPNNPAALDLNGDGDTTDLGESDAVKPSLLVITGPGAGTPAGATAHTVTVGPVHVNNTVFQGVVMADTINKMNGNGKVVGSIFSFNKLDGTKIGNGTFDVDFSSAVVGNLPGPVPDSVDGAVALTLWREAN